jgi:hypothetical protein
LPWFFWNKITSSSLIIFQRAKLSVHSTTHLCWCNCRTYWRNKPRYIQNGGPVFHYNAPAHRAVATRKKHAFLGLQCLNHTPYSLDLGPSDYHLFAGLLKKLNVAFFSDTPVIGAAEYWLDGQNSEFIIGLQNLVLSFVGNCFE